MADLKISELTALDTALVAAGDQLPIVDTSASQTKKVSADGLVAAGIRLMPNASIPWAKVDGGSITVPNNSITTLQLADNSVATSKVVDGAITDAKITGPISLSKLGNQGANVVLAGPVTGAAAAPTFRAIVPADLPNASSTTLGVVSVPTAGGLVIDGNAAVSLSSTVTAGSSPVVTYGADGRITAGRALTGADLPIATTSVIGGVKPGSGLSVSADGTLSAALTAANMPLATSTTVGGVKPGPGLSVDASGALGVTNSIAAGTGAKVTYNAQGMITGVSALAAADIPDLDASKIVSGTLPGSHVADRSITQQKLADYSIAYIQESSPGAATGSHPIGELWFQESTAKLSMWNGNSWMPVGQGALSDENMRFCGLFNAATGLVTAVTQFGSTAGLSNGGPIPAASNTLTGVYLACDTAGTHDTKVYDVGDWILCLGQSRGWERVDLAAGGGGGGGGATTLDGLVDVTVTTPSGGDVLVFNGTKWVNGPLPDPGTY
jgi:hypothetical protein